jgi:hypothetical protein
LFLCPACLDFDFFSPLLAPAHPLAQSGVRYTDCVEFNKSST